VTILVVDFNRQSFLFYWFCTLTIH